jgi:maleate cis-trans isomerase
MQRVMPIFRWGSIGPSRGGAVQVGPGYRFYRIVPTNVILVTTGLVGLNDYTKEDVNRAIQSYWECVDLLVNAGVDVIVFGGAPISAQLGRQRVLELFDETRKRTGLPVTGTLESAIEAMNHLNVKRIVIASLFAEPVNQAFRKYFEDAGIEVVAVPGRGMWAPEFNALTFEQRQQLQLDMGEEAAQLAPTAEGVLIPGGSIAEVAIVPVEEKYGKTVFTNNNTEVWTTLIRTGIIPPIEGWGRLLATP